MTLRHGQERYRLVVLAEARCRWQAAREAIDQEGGGISVKESLLAAGPIVRMTVQPRRGRLKGTGRTGDQRTT